MARRLLMSATENKIPGRRSIESRFRPTHREDAVKRWIVALLAMLAFGSTASSEPAPEGELAKKLKETYAAAAEKLVAMQDSAGAWKMGPEGKQTPSPSSTGLIVASLASAPEPIRTKFKDATAKGLAYILS